MRALARRPSSDRPCLIHGIASLLQRRRRTAAWRERIAQRLSAIPHCAIARRIGQSVAVNASIARPNSRSAAGRRLDEERLRGGAAGRRE